MSGSSFCFCKNFEQVFCLPAAEIFGNILVQTFFIFASLVAGSLVESVVMSSFARLLISQLMKTYFNSNDVFYIWISS